MPVHDYASALEELFDVTYDIVFFVKDALGRYVMVNQTMVERLNLTSKRDLLGRTSADLYPAPLGQSYLEQDLYVIQTGQKIINKLEHQLYLNGESGWCVTNKVPL
jgi:PAS domain-containing protein